MIRLAVLPGDGVGPEVMEGPTALLRKLVSQRRLELTGPWPVGAASYASTGEGLPGETLSNYGSGIALFLVPFKGKAGEASGKEGQVVKVGHLLKGAKPPYPISS